MTQLTYETFVDELRSAVPGFGRVYDEHVSDNDEVLPHVLLGDLVRFLSNEVEVRGVEGTGVKPAMDLLERAMDSSDLRLQELVVVSFLENLDPNDPSFFAIRALFGARLEDQYRYYEEAHG